MQITQTRTQFNRITYGSRSGPTFVGWLPAGTLPILAALWVGTKPGWMQMLAMAMTLLIGLKWLSWWPEFRRGLTGGWWRTLAYFSAWPGMDARAFLESNRRLPTPPMRDWLVATIVTALGGTLIWLAVYWLMAMPALLAGWVGIAGLLLLFHFGLFHLLSITFRSAGVDAQPLMDRPWLAEHVSDFWGRRWNRAFRDVALRSVYRPLVRPLGSRGALAMVFLFSAILHELVISLPAGGGYGLPSAYFALQLGGMIVERSQWANRMVRCRQLSQRLFTWVVVFARAPLLFHQAFVLRVIVPFLGIGNGAL